MEVDAEAVGEKLQEPSCACGATRGRGFIFTEKFGVSGISVIMFVRL